MGKTAVIRFRVTMEQKEQIESAAAFLGMSVSQYMISRLIEPGNIPPLARLLIEKGRIDREMPEVSFEVKKSKKRKPVPKPVPPITIQEKTPGILLPQPPPIPKPKNRVETVKDFPSGPKDQPKKVCPRCIRIAGRHLLGCTECG